MTASHSSSVIRRKSRSRRMPAALTRMSSRPKLSTAALTMLSPPSTVATLSELAIALPARRDDLVGDRLRRPAARTAAVDGDAEVVHDDSRAFRRQRQRHRPADASAGACHRRDAVLQPIRHVATLIPLPRAVRPPLRG